MLPLLLLCDIPIHFEAGSSSLLANMKTRAHTWLQAAGSLIKSIAFLIIQNWLEIKGVIRGIKTSAAFSRPVSRWVPDTLHDYLLLSLVVDLGLSLPQLLTGAAL